MTTDTFEDGEDEIAAGDQIIVEINDTDPRRVWSLSVDYEEPVDEAFAAGLRALVRLGSRAEDFTASDTTVSRFRDAMNGAAEAVDEAQATLRGYVAPASGIAPENTQTLEDAADALQAALQHLNDTASSLSLAEGARTRVRSILSRGRDVASAISGVLRWARRAVESRNLTVRVRGGYRLMVLRLCERHVDMSTTSIVTSTVRCTDSRYRMRILDTSPLVLRGGLLMPVFATNPTTFQIGDADALVANVAPHPLGTVQPSTSLFVRLASAPRDYFAFGAEAVAALGDRFGSGFGIGLGVEWYSVSLSAGAYVDLNGDRVALPSATGTTVEARTATNPIGGAYLQFSLGLDLLTTLDRAFDDEDTTGPDNDAPSGDETPAEDGNEDSDSPPENSETDRDADSHGAELNEAGVAGGANLPESTSEDVP